jgi:hypothetical protein
VAEAGDILTLAEARAALRQGTSTASDTEIALLVTAASIAIDRGTGPVVTRTITGDTYDGDDDGAGHTTSMIQLRYWPVGSVTTVTEDGATLTAVTDYHIDLEKGQLWRRSGDYDWRWECGRDNITVTYTAGRFANTAAVDSWWKQGARLLVRHLWRAEQWNVAGIGPQEFDVPQVAYPTFAIPKAVMDWYGPLWRLSSRDPAEARGGFA